jgi:hypothetical protein
MGAMETQGSGGEKPAVAAESDEASREVRAISLALYRRVLTTIFLAGLFFVAVPFVIFLVPILLSSASDGIPSIFVIVLLSGALGALFSTLIRVYNYDNVPAVLVSRELNGISHYHLFMYSLVPLVVGSIAAGAFFMLMASGMLQGTMFARFACLVDKGCNTLSGMAQYWAPATAQEYGKAIIWGFVCGFAERLVPDALREYLTTPRRSKREL